MENRRINAGSNILVIIVSVISTYFASKTAMSFGRDLRNAVFEKV